MEMGEALIVLAEHEISGSPLTAFQREVFLNQGAHVLKRLGLDLVYEPTTDGIAIRLKAAALVGAARFIHKRSFVDVVVEPKVGVASVFHILEFIHQTPSFSSGHSSVFRSGDTVTDVIIRLIVEEILTFLERHHFRDYALRRDFRSSAIKGRLLQAEYIRESCPRLRQYKLPCEFFEFSQNTVENQIVLSALLVAARLVSVASNGVRANLRRRIGLGLSILADVEPVYRDHRDIDRMVYTRRNIVFQPVHQLCRFLFSNSSVSLNPGQRVQFSSFAFNMNSMFESYVRSLMRSAFGSIVRMTPNSREYKITGLEKTIRLDGLVHDGGRRCVIECKNKLVTSEEKPDFDEGELRNADVYQVVAYAMHDEIKATTCALFYPFVGSLSFPAKLVGTSMTFFGAAGIPLPVNVLLINMQAKPTEIVGWLIGRLELFLPQ